MKYYFARNLADSTKVIVVANTIANEFHKPYYYAMNLLADSTKLIVGCGIS